ncbi:DNA pilot protein [Microviridae sp.]|nr:DNA pilot protein [Microviridae sp.]
MLGTLLDLGTSLVGLNQAKKSNKQQQANFNQSMKQAQGQFDAQMDQSVQRRVADAKEAGVHPLFALGASVGSSPTLSAGASAQAPTGSGIGDAIAGLADKLGQVELNKSSTARNQAAARRDDAESLYLNSQRARLQNDLASRGRDGAGVKTFPYGTEPANSPVQFGPDSPSGKATYYAPEIPQHGKNAGIVAGTRPGTLTARMPDGRTVNLYDPDLGLDEISQVNYAWQRAIHHTTDAAMWTHNKVNNWFKRQAKRIKGERNASQSRKTQRPRRY